MLFTTAFTAVAIIGTVVMPIPSLSAFVLKQPPLNTNLETNILHKSFGNVPFTYVSSPTVLHDGNPFQSLIDSFSQESKPEIPKEPDLVVDPDYKLAISFGAVGAIFVALVPTIIGPIFGTLLLLLATLFAVQAGRIRFVFDETAFELKQPTKEDGDELKATRENIVVGGANRWSYESFVNWDFFPSVDFPILVYFKETQTPSELWNEGPGKLDEIGGGQIHFFPALGNAKQLESQFELRGCAKIEKS